MGNRRGQVEDLDMNDPFWYGRRVLVTGHTGFMGGWLSLMLSELGASVHGFALPPEPGAICLFEALRLATVMDHRIGDVRKFADVELALGETRPEIVFHLAAQSLVKISYADPVSTYATNVMGTVHLLDACRRADSVRAIVVITSDKCYDNLGWVWGYRETDNLGGADPYSNSKACAELVVSAYRESFFGAEPSIGIATARAGNVIGGGDWAAFRLIPDAMRAFFAGKVLKIRNPKATRPWQHVLEPLRGYLMLARALAEGAPVAEAWNFGPDDADNWPVQVVAEKLINLWGDGGQWEIEPGTHAHEALLLHVDSSKSRARLGWRPILPLDEALGWTVEWYRQFRDDADLKPVTVKQIGEFLARAKSGLIEATT
jgi:CDP-glucose 4,6-dehydratase